MLLCSQILKWFPFHYIHICCVSDVVKIEWIGFIDLNERMEFVNLITLKVLLNTNLVLLIGVIEGFHWLWLF